MRSFNAAFASLLAGRDKRPRFVLQVSFSDTALDDVYVRSHGDIDLTHVLTGIRWDFTNSANSFAATNGTLTNHSTFVTFLSTNTANYVETPAAQVIAGPSYWKVRMRVRRTTTVGTWVGVVRYTTSGGGHGAAYSASYQKTIPDTTVLDQWVILEWDMSALDGSGGNDWTANTITRIAFILDNATAKSFDIDWIQIAGAPNIMAARTQKISVLSQQIYPDDGRATIGAFSFDALDTSQSLTTAQRDALKDESHGLRYKFVRLWIGFAELDWDDYELYATQIVYGTKYNSGVYSFTCNDVQREARKTVFEIATLALAQPIDATTTTIPINGNTALIQALEHDDAFSDGPGLTVAYIKIDDEIIRVPDTGIDPNEFTGVTRGALGTRAVEHSTDLNVTADQQKKVEEVIYLEMNAVKMARAVLTGVLANQATFMPDTWHAGVDESFIDVDSFDDIGADLYDGTDEGGIVLRFLGLDSEDAKAWVEKQICRIIGCYMPVRSDGRLALKRLERVLHGAAPVADLTDRELMGAVDLTYAMNQIYNRLEVDWNAIDGDPTRFTEIDDQESIDKWQASDVKVIEAFGLHGSRHSADAVRQLFDRWRDRYSGPPVLTSPRVRLAMAALEVGDIVRVVSATARDFTDPRAAGTLDRSFEVQATSLNWMTGEFRPNLFGSTQAGSALPRSVTDEAIPDAWFDDLGTNIAGLGGVTLVSGVYHMTTNRTFAGGASNRTSGSVWYILGDLNIDPGVTLTISGNVQIRVLGVLTVNGAIDGVGLGLAGVADTLDASSWPYINLNVRQPWNGVTCQTGQAGYYGSPRAGGGLYERTRKESVGGEFWIDAQSFAAPATQGTVDIVPTLQIAFDGTIVTGVPSSLMGSSGGPGGKRHWSNTRNSNVQEINPGGTGGASGAGLFVVCRGMAFGVAGSIDLSGVDGSIGDYDAGDAIPGHAGAGAGGAPGAFVCVVDGVLNPQPVLNDQTFIANYGAVPEPADPPGFTDMQTAWLSDKIELPGGDRPENARSYFLSPTSGLKAGVAAARALFLSAPQDFGEDMDLPKPTVGAGDSGEATVRNANFELGRFVGWRLGNGFTINYAPASAHRGNYVLQAFATGGLSNTTNLIRAPCAPGDQVTFGGWLATSGSFTGSAGFAIAWVDSSGAQISTPSVGVVAPQTLYGQSKRAGNIAPANTQWVEFICYGNVSVGTAYYDDCFMQVQTGAKLGTSVVDSTGAVVTDIGGLNANVMSTSGDGSVAFTYDNTDYQSQRSTAVRYTYDVGGTFQYQNGSTSADANREFPWLDNDVKFYRGGTLIKTLTFRHLCNPGSQSSSARLGSIVRSVWYSSSGPESDGSFTVDIGSDTGRTKWNGTQFGGTHDVFTSAMYGGSAASYTITITYTGSESGQKVCRIFVNLASIAVGSPTK